MANRIAILADFPWSFFDSGSTGRGGGQQSTWLSQIAEQYSGSSDYDVHWISLNQQNRWIGSRRRRNWGGQAFCEIGLGSATANLELNYLPSRWLLGREISQLKPDLIHCWGTEYSYAVMCKALTIPSILSMQGIMTEYDRIGTFGDSRYWKNVSRWEPEFLRSATIVTTESLWGMNLVKKIAPTTDVRIVEYGVNRSFYDLIWSPEQTAPFALYSGSIDRRKGVDILVEAVAAITDRNWTLKIAGDGPLRAELEARKVPGVEWLGLLEWSCMQKLLTRAQCFVLPTKADTSPNAVKEARVVGLPVVTTAHGGQAGYIRNGENGFIVDPLTPQQLGHALNRVMRDPNLARHMGDTRHEEDRDYFKPKHTAKGFHAIYHELLTR